MYQSISIINQGTEGGSRKKERKRRKKELRKRRDGEGWKEGEKNNAYIFSL